MTPSLPADWRIEPDHALRQKDAGHTLIGGSPMGIIRLSNSGATIAAALLGGEPVGAPSSRVDLARRLIERGMAHPLPAGAHMPRVSPEGSGPTTNDVTVIIPVHGEVETLRRTLEALPSVARIIVVDDASPTELAITPAMASSPIELLRNDINLGPGSSRNRGLAAADTEFVLFVDDDVVIDAPGLDALVGYFADADVVAVAPRIVPRIVSTSPDRDGTATASNTATAGETALDRYERTHSPLDLGPRPSAVRPGNPVSYVPTACLLVRRHTLREVGPFDPALRFGEDVDLVWRLRSVGSVRYVPTVVATHPNRTSLTAFVRQRFGYGSAAGPLGVRHGAAVAPLRCSGWTLAVLGLGLSGHGRLALLLHAATTRALVTKLGPLSDPLVEATRLTSTGTVWAARTAARSGVRVWWPLMVLGLLLPPTRPAARRWLRWSMIERLVTGREADPRQLALGLLDDVSYGAGVWWGARRARSFASLLPATGDQSTAGRFTIKSSNWTTSSVSMLRKRISALRST